MTQALSTSKPKYAIQTTPTPPTRASWKGTTTATGLFYGLFGALRLGVTIDIVLLLGALVALVVVFLPKVHAARPASAH